MVNLLTPFRVRSWIRLIKRSEPRAAPYVDVEFSVERTVSESLSYKQTLFNRSNRYWIMYYWLSFSTYSGDEKCLT